jgi:UDP-glucuronate 4-epimerase
MNATGIGSVLVTGGAGFIGSHLCERLLSRGLRVVAVDSFDPFYPESVKRQNIRDLVPQPGFRLIEADIRATDALLRALEEEDRVPDAIVHLAARAGVRPSIEDPVLYSQVNVEGTTSVLELARRLGVAHVIFGSSSSVYGDSAPVPFSEEDVAASPISPYAATKRAGELLCHTYHHLHRLSVVCLRFFTVYGPRQRPDLAIHKFTRLISRGEPVPMFGDGSTERDYTFVDDIIDGVEGALEYCAAAEPVFEIVNLGESRTTSLSRLIELIGTELGVRPEIQQLPWQPGDVQRTFANVSRARRLWGYAPRVPVEEGIPRFVQWFRAAQK